MWQISIILIAGLVFLFSFNRSPGDVSVELPLTISITIVFTFLPAIIAYILGIAAIKRLSDEMEARVKQLYFLKQVFFSFEIIILAAFVVEVHYLNLPLLVDQGLTVWKFQYTRRLFVITPLILGILLIRMSQYELDRRVRLTQWNRREFVSFNAKIMSLPIIPIFLYLAILDIIEETPLPLRILFIEHAYLTIFLLVMLIVIAYIKAPLLMRFLWPAKPLGDHELNNRLQSLASLYNIKYKNIFVWQTGGAKIANAGVAGLLPSSRGIFVTDYLLANFSHEEIEAIVAHEFGHIRYRHIHIYLAFSFAYFACYTLFYGYIGPLLIRLVGSGPIANAMITIAFFYIYFVLLFRYFSRKFERQADLYAVEITGKPEVFQQALWKLAAVNYIPRAMKKLFEILHTHPSIVRRIEFIDYLSSGGMKAERYKNFLLEAKLVLFATPVLLGMLLLVGQNVLSAPADIHFDKGRQYYKEAVKNKSGHKKESAAAYFHRAAEEFHATIALEPEYEDAHYALGLIHAELDDLQTAAENFQRVLEINPEHSDARKYLKQLEGE